MASTLKKDVAYQALQGFFEKKPFVLFGTGTSCAVDRQFGMDALRDFLVDELAKAGLSPVEQGEWREVLDDLESNKDFEAAMDGIKSSELLGRIVQGTAKFVSQLDRSYSERILLGDKAWPAIWLFQKMVNFCSGSENILHVATTNYDLLAEYAFCKANIDYLTGFHGGVVRKQSWEHAGRTMQYWEKVAGRGKKQGQQLKTKKHIRLYKVHGSINTFTQDESLVENDAWMQEAPPHITRVMVTPGTLKHEQLHNHRDALLDQYDKEVKNHKAFLFLGFGFNDGQITKNAIEKKLKDGGHGLIITRDSNPRIEALAQQSPNAWVVCKHEDESRQGTRIYNKGYSGWLYLDDETLWDFAEFAKKILDH